MAVAELILAEAGETVDGLVHRATGRGTSAVDVVLAANPALADVGVFLPRGQAVTIPAAARDAETLPLIQLWD